jgi:hypothetical protein
MGKRAAQLLGDDGLRTRMSIAMRANALKRADRESIARHEREVFDRLLGPRQ